MIISDDADGGFWGLDLDGDDSEGTRLRDYPAGISNAGGNVGGMVGSGGRLLVAARLGAGLWDIDPFGLDTEGTRLRSFPAGLTNPQAVDVYETRLLIVHEGHASTDYLWDIEPAGADTEGTQLRSLPAGVGRPEGLAVLVVIPVPARPAAPTVIALTNTSARVIWVAPDDSGSPITGYRLRYRIRGESNWTDVAGLSGLTHDLTGLVPASVYQIQVGAINANGNSDYSPSAYISMPESVTPTQPTGPFSIFDSRVVSGYARPGTTPGVVWRGEQRGFDSYSSFPTGFSGQGSVDFVAGGALDAEVHSDYIAFGGIGFLNLLYLSMGYLYNTTTNNNELLLKLDLQYLTTGSHTPDGITSFDRDPDLDAAKIADLEIIIQAPDGTQARARLSDIVTSAGTASRNYYFVVNDANATALYNIVSSLTSGAGGIAMLVDRTNANVDLTNYQVSSLHGDPQVTIDPVPSTVRGGDILFLSASVSDSFGGTIVGMLWTGEGEFADPTSLITQWTAPIGSANVRRTDLTLTATDNHGDSNSASVTIRILPDLRTPPLHADLDAAGGFHISIRGKDIRDRVIQGSVEINGEVSQQPTARFRMHFPRGVSLADQNVYFELSDGSAFGLADGAFWALHGSSTDVFPVDFMEVVIDFPGTPYRRVALANVALVSYWTFDDPVGDKFADSELDNDISFPAGADQHIGFRAYERENAAVPHGGTALLSIGAAPLTMPTLPTIGTDWTMCGFVLCDATSGTRAIWAVGASTGVRVTASATGWVVSATADGVSGMTSGTLTLNRWYHVALRRSSTRTGLWIDGVEVGGGAPANASNAALDAANITWGAGTAAGVCEIALDEWALLSIAIDVADLAGRVRYARLFGGYVYGPQDDPVMGSGVGGRYITVNCVGYSKFLERAFLPQALPVTSGEMVKVLVDRVLPLAEVPDVFTTNGIVLDEELEGGEFDYQSIAEVLRDLGKLFNAVSWVDAWGEMQLRLRGGQHDLRRHTDRPGSRQLPPVVPATAVREPHNPDRRRRHRRRRQQFGRAGERRRCRAPHQGQDSNDRGVGNREGAGGIGYGCRPIRHLHDTHGARRGAILGSRCAAIVEAAAAQHRRDRAGRAGDDDARARHAGRAARDAPGAAHGTELRAAVRRLLAVASTGRYGVTHETNHHGGDAVAGAGGRAGAAAVGRTFDNFPEQTITNEALETYVYDDARVNPSNRDRRMTIATMLANRLRTDLSNVSTIGSQAMADFRAAIGVPTFAQGANVTFRVVGGTTFIDAMGGGAGGTTFVALTDTPNALGTSGQYLRVNAGRTALYFDDAAAGGDDAFDWATEGNNQQIPTAKLGNAGIEIVDGTTLVHAHATRLIFDGDGVTIGQGGGSAHVTFNIPHIPMHDEGVQVQAAPSFLNCVGAGISCTADGMGARINVLYPGSYDWAQSGNVGVIPASKIGTGASNGRILYGTGATDAAWTYLSNIASGFTERGVLVTGNSGGVDLVMGGSVGQVLTYTAGGYGFAAPTGQGGGLTAVETDNSLNGDGTAGDPLRVDGTIARDAEVATALSNAVADRLRRVDLLEGANITLTSGLGNQVTIASTGTGGTGLASVATDGTLDGDGTAGDPLSASAIQTEVTTLSAAVDTKLERPDLIAGTNVTLTPGVGNTVTIAATGGGVGPDTNDYVETAALALSGLDLTLTLGLTGALADVTSNAITLPSSGGTPGTSTYTQLSSLDFDTTSASAFRSVVDSNGDAVVPSADFEWLHFNGGNAFTTVGGTKGTPGQWNRISKVQWDALVAAAVSASPSLTNSRSYRDFVINSSGGTTARDFSVGKTAAGAMLLTSDNAAEDFLPFTLVQEVVGAGSGGPGATTFAGLTDTPAALGTTGQIPAVDAAGTALEFIDAPTGGTGTSDTKVVTALPATADVVDADKGKVWIVQSMADGGSEEVAHFTPVDANIMEFTSEPFMVGGERVIGFNATHGHAVPYDTINIASLYWDTVDNNTQIYFTADRTPFDFHGITQFALYLREAELEGDWERLWLEETSGNSGVYNTQGAQATASITAGIEYHLILRSITAQVLNSSVTTVPATDRLEMFPNGGRFRAFADIDAFGHLNVAADVNRVVDGEVDSAALTLVGQELTLDVGRTVGPNLGNTVTLPAAAGSAFDIHDDVGFITPVQDTDRFIFSDENQPGDPMRYLTANSLATYVNAKAVSTADGVATAGVYDAANTEIDFTVAAPGSDFSVDVSGLGGGGGNGTTVTANPGTPTDDLQTVTIDTTNYAVAGIADGPWPGVSSASLRRVYSDTTTINNQLSYLRDGTETTITMGVDNLSSQWRGYSRELGEWTRGGRIRPYVPVELLTLAYSPGGGLVLLLQPQTDPNDEVLLAGTDATAITVRYRCNTATVFTDALVLGPTTTLAGHIQYETADDYSGGVPWRSGDVCDVKFQRADQANEAELHVGDHQAMLATDAELDDLETELRSAFAPSSGAVLLVDRVAWTGATGTLTLLDWRSYDLLIFDLNDSSLAKDRQFIGLVQGFDDRGRATLVGGGSNARVSLGETASDSDDVSLLFQGNAEGVPAAGDTLSVYAMSVGGSTGQRGEDGDQGIQGEPGQDGQDGQDGTGGGTLDIPGLAFSTVLGQDFDFVVDAGAGNRRISTPNVFGHAAGTGLNVNTVSGVMSVSTDYVTSLDAGSGIDIGDGATQSPEVQLDLSELPVIGSLAGTFGVPVVDASDVGSLTTLADISAFVQVGMGASITAVTTGGTSGLNHEIAGGSLDIELDVHRLTEQTVLQPGDLFAFADVSVTNANRHAPLSSIGTLFAGGNGVTFTTSTGFMDLDFSEFTTSTTADVGSFIPFQLTGGGLRRITVANMFGAWAGPGVEVVGNQYHMDIEGLPTISTLAGADLVGVMDLSNANNRTRGISWNNMMNLAAGSHISNTSGVLAVTPGSLDGFGLEVISNQLAVDASELDGFGLTLDGALLAVDTSDFDGFGLQVSAGSLLVRSSDLDGDGLREVNNQLAVRPSDFDGNGLAADGNDMALDIVEVADLPTGENLKTNDHFLVGNTSDSDAVLKVGYSRLVSGMLNDESRALSIILDSDNEVNLRVDFTSGPVFSTLQNADKFGVTRAGNPPDTRAITYANLLGELESDIDTTPPNNSITKAKMADDAVGPDEMDPESATEPARS